MTIINLNENVLKTLDFFKANPPPGLDLNQYKLPFVVGSGNALNTGKIIFSQQAAIFADESNFKSVIKSYQSVIKKNLITQAVIISASGEKDSVWETELAKKHQLKTSLLTCNSKSSAAKIADKIFTYRKIAEPYTYNFSTYLGMILSTTKEKPTLIKKFILQQKLPQNYGKYTSYAFLLPDKHNYICPMLDVKKNELFGPHLSIRAFTFGHARHAKFVHPWQKELVISLGEKNKYFGHPQHRWDITTPSFANHATYMALAYYLIGKIQASKPAYFKKNIAAFCKNYGPKAYGKKQVFEIIVPGN